MSDEQSSLSDAQHAGQIREPEMEEIPIVRNYEVVVRIKKSSKYFHQGLNDPTNSKSGQRFFKLSSFIPHHCPGAMVDGYFLRFNSNNYRIEDCEFYLRDAANPKNLLRLR